MHPGKYRGYFGERPVLWPPWQLVLVEELYHVGVWEGWSSR
jgi:hypothetical protein